MACLALALLLVTSPRYPQANWALQVLIPGWVVLCIVICEIEGSRSRNRKTLTLKRFIDGLLAKQSFYLRRGGLSQSDRSHGAL